MRTHENFNAEKKKKDLQAQNEQAFTLAVLAAW